MKIGGLTGKNIRLEKGETLFAIAGTGPQYLTYVLRNVGLGTIGC